MDLVFPLRLFLIDWPLLVLIAYFLTIGVLWSLRDYQEGLAYNVSRASQFGDMFLFAIVFMAAQALQEGKAMPAWLNTTWAQALIATPAVVAVMSWYIVEQKKNDWGKVYWGEIYHAAVIVPGFIFFGINAGVIIFHNGGSRIGLAVICLGAWLALVAWDGFNGRLSQRKFLFDSGIRGLKS